MPPEIKSDISQFVKNFKYSSYTAQLQAVLHDFSVAAVDGFHSSFIRDNEAEIRNLQRQTAETKEKIEKSSNDAAQRELEKQMLKLKDVVNINTPSEGFVFDFNGVTYKFTGNFAPANQIFQVVWCCC